MHHNIEHSLHYFISEIKYYLGFMSINFQGGCVRVCVFCLDNLGHSAFHC